MPIGCSALVVVLVLLVGPQARARGPHVMHENTKEMLERGHSWNTDDNWESSTMTQRWEAWKRATSKLYKSGKVKRTPGAVLGKRWEHGLPTEMHCADGICKIERKGHIRASLASKAGLVVCRDCPNPHKQGSFVDIWPCHYQMHDYQIDAEIVYAVPNDARQRILNAHHLKDNIALVDRGKVDLVEKLKWVEKSGALAAIIVDDGSCKENFDCGRMGQRQAGEGFAARDNWNKWVGVNTPCFLVSKSGGERLKSMMPLQKVKLGKLGMQFVCEEDI